LIPVELAPEVTASLRAMKDRGTPPPRCHSGVITSAIAGAMRPYSTYVRGVIVDGDRGVLLTGSGGSAVVIEG
jgi:hypothetical protein